MLFCQYNFVTKSVSSAQCACTQNCCCCF